MKALDTYEAENRLQAEQSEREKIAATMPVWIADVSGLWVPERWAMSST